MYGIILELCQRFWYSLVDCSANHCFNIQINKTSISIFSRRIQMKSKRNFNEHRKKDLHAGVWISEILLTINCGKFQILSFFACTMFLYNFCERCFCSRVNVGSVRTCSAAAATQSLWRFNDLKILYYLLIRFLVLSSSKISSCFLFIISSAVRIY